MDAILAVIVFMAAFFFIIPFIADLSGDEDGDSLDEQALTIETVVAADRPVSFLKGAELQSRKFSYMTSVKYDDLKKEFGIIGDFCIYFEDQDGDLIRTLDDTGKRTVVGIGDPRVTIDGDSCKTGFGDCTDLDGDGYGVGDMCSDRDCDDTDRAIYFGAPEICDGKDNDCNPATEDGDVESGAPCGTDIGACSSGIQGCFGGALLCTGTMPQPEVCSDLSLDENCNDAAGCADPDCFSDPACLVPEDCSNSADDDGDTLVDCADPDCFGDPACFVCADADGDLVSPDGGACGPVDCDDTNVLRNPWLAEACDNLDNDCDGSVDEGNPGGGAYCGTDAGTCVHGSTTCNLGVYDCAGSVMPIVEICGDGLDNDCDGAIDNGCGVCTDADGDTFSPEGGACGLRDCNDGVFAIKPGAPELCDGVDNDCDGIVDEGCAVCTDIDGDTFSPEGGACGLRDCNDGVFAIKPGAPEICDALDNDCDGTVDEGCPGCVDADGDTFSPGGGACGLVDCDDTRDTVFPGALEVCNGRDDNCAGGIDEGNPGGGARCGATDVGACAYGTRTCAAGALSCIGEVTSTPEICDALDNDCDGSVNEGLMFTSYQDLDLDGYGNPTRSLYSCAPPDGYVSNNRDCNDGNAGIHPGSIDYCIDFIDDDCSGSAHRDDSDRDGYQDSICGGPDCNDGNAGIHPGATEILDDGLDNNCNGCNAKSAVPPSLFSTCFACERDGGPCPLGCCWG